MFIQVPLLWTEVESGCLNCTTPEARNWPKTRPRQPLPVGKLCVASTSGEVWSAPVWKVPRKSRRWSVRPLWWPCPLPQPPNNNLWTEYRTWTWVIIACNGLVMRAISWRTLAHRNRIKCASKRLKRREDLNITWLNSNPIRIRIQIAITTIMAMSRSRRTPRNFLEGYFNDDFWKSSCDTSNPTRVPFSLSLASSYEHSMDSSLPSVLLFKIFYSSHFGNFHWFSSRCLRFELIKLPKTHPDETFFFSLLFSSSFFSSDNDPLCQGTELLPLPLINHVHTLNYNKTTLKEFLDHNTTKCRLSQFNQLRPWRY